VKQCVKSLKGKRLASALDFWPTPVLLHGALASGRVSVGSGHQRKAARMWFPWSFITRGSKWCDRVEDCGFGPGRWLNGSKRPVLKHGPRSLTSMRVFGCQARPRNESEFGREPKGAPSTGPEVYRWI
jgi:hypothetical protein